MTDWNTLHTSDAAEKVGIQKLPAPITWTALHNFGLEVASHYSAANKELVEALTSFVYEFGDKTNSATVNKARAVLAKHKEQQ